VPAAHFALARRVASTAPSIPAAPWFRLDPRQVGPAERLAGRHGWLAALAWQHAAGHSEAGDLALSGLSAWLDADRPGRGDAWVHSTDLTARLLHWLAALGWLGAMVDLSLRARLAGSAALHLEHLAARLQAPSPGDPRRLLQLVGIAAGGQGWPGLPAAGVRAATALAALPAAFEQLVTVDGTPADGDQVEHGERLAHLLLLLALGRVNRTPLPRVLLPRLVQAARQALTGPGASPGTLEPLLPLPRSNPMASPWNTVLALGLCSGSPHPGFDGFQHAVAGPAAGSGRVG